MLKNILIISFFIICHSVYGQRFSTGIVLGLDGVNRVTLPDNFIFSQNSYHIYYTSNEDKDGEPVYDKYFNGASIALSGSLDYKRYMLTTEVGLGVSTIEIPVLYPSELGSILDQQVSNFRTTRRSFLFNLIMNIRLSRKANGIYLQFGTQYSYNTYNEKNQITDESVTSSNISPALSLFLSENELYGTLYNNNPHYVRAIGGLGYKKDDWYLGLRYYKRLAQNERLPLARYHQIEVTLSKMISFQKLRKGYHIYME